MVVGNLKTKIMTTENSKDGRYDHCCMCSAVLIDRKSVNRITSACIRGKKGVLYDYVIEGGEQESGFSCTTEFPEETDVPLMGRSGDYVLIMVEQCYDALDVQNGDFVDEDVYELFGEDPIFMIARRCGDSMKFQY